MLATRTGLRACDLVKITLLGFGQVACCTVKGCEKNFLVEAR